MATSGWIGVDLDGTLAQYGGWKPLVSNNEARRQGLIGEPVPAMLERVKKWIAEGTEVRIFTARVCDGDPETVKQIEDWSELHVGVRLKVTNVKDFSMVELWDDRAIQVEKNTGRVMDDHAAALGALSHDFMLLWWAARKSESHSLPFDLVSLLVVPSLERAARNVRDQLMPLGSRFNGRFALAFPYMMSRWKDYVR